MMEGPPTRPTTQMPAATRSSLVLETLAESMRSRDFTTKFNQARIQMRRQGTGDNWGLTVFGSDSYEVVHQVARREVDIALMNPAGPLLAAYRGTGPFREPMPVRAITVIPSLDWLGFAVTEATGLRSLADIKERKYPLRVSVRNHADHASHVYIDEVLACYGFSLADIESWGGLVTRDGHAPFDEHRGNRILAGTLDAVFDEALSQFVPRIDRFGMRLLPLDEPVLKHMDDIGFLRSTIVRSHFPSLPADVPALDFSGWPVYTHADAPEDLIYEFCRSLDARKSQVVWQEPRDLPLAEMCRDTPAAPLKIPLHPAAERYWREAGYLK
ncbi:MAG: hypothetical protein HW416_1669 [Chloroflexi bacterium]|nr:hypothetical protein [Chloroflexota bacterium]